ncbi:MAG: selenide, water dikinase SelD [Pseudorhodobacter sp.]
MGDEPEALRMTGNDWPMVKDLLLIGGGHAHALVLRRWGMDPQPGTRVTVVNPGPVAPYTGMLPGHVAGHYGRDEMMIDLVRLARFAGARVVLDRVEALDRDARRARLRSGRWLHYDVASLDVGIASDLPGLPGFDDHAAAAKPLGPYAARWEAFLADCPAQPRLVVIGGGIGGAELAMAMSHRLRGLGRRPQVTLLERSAHMLPGLGAGAQRVLIAALADQGVTLRTGAEPATIGADRVQLADGTAIASDFTLSVAGARPQGWLADTGLDLTDGFVTVTPELQSSDPQVFAVGDCAHMAHAPRPKAGVFAVRQAPVLYHNLRAILAGGAGLRSYHPQRDYLKLISTGEKSAVADRSGLPLRGKWLWRWKDRIDRKFMAKFEEYPAMARPAIPAGAAAGLAEALGPKPICGGCGAKVGAAVLTEALAALPAPQRADVISGPGDDAGLLRIGGAVQALTTDHLRAFTHDAALMARLAAIHALGDVWAMGAAPQAVLAQITLPLLGAALQADMLSEILNAATEVIRAAGGDLIGGHSAVGAELTIGFTVTGLVAKEATRKRGAEAGDALILTKPIGTGAILAAEMAAARVPGLLLGEAVAAAFASMARPLGPAAAVLAPGAHAMTDVTGFGLAGHLLEILAPAGQEAGLAADLDRGAIPFLPGAEAVAQAGHGSTLLPANRAAAMPFVEASGTGGLLDLLFDPQTCGGLLAAVPGAQAAGLVAALHRAGDTRAAIIGQVTAGPTRLRIRG